MQQVQQLLTEHLDIWTAAETEKKSGRGRASGSAGKVYGIQKLRGLILELAVRGKLVPQDANDQPASEVLKRIQTEKAKLIADGKLKKEKTFAPIGDDEKPFELPKGWLLVRLDDIGNTFIGLTYSPKDISNDGIPVLRSSNIQNGKIHLDDLVRVNKEIKENLFVENGDLLICARNGSKALVGKTAMIKNLSEPMVFGAFMAIYKSQLNEYIEIFLNSPLFRKFLDGVETTTINQITQNNLKTTLLPLPPLKEQHRIVAKVDELMALCDQLEQQHSDAAIAHEKLVEHLLATLTQAQNAQDFNSQWQRIFAHFDTLFITEASIEALKQTLLQLAVMGKLVPQDANDEPASELLKRIQAEKAQLIADGKLKKEKPLEPVAEDEKPFDLPKGWEWARFESLLINASVGLDRGKSQQSDEMKYAYFKMNNIKNEGGCDYTDLARVNASSEELDRFMLYDGDFLFNTRNSRELVGKTCVIRYLPEKNIIYNNNILRVQFSNFIQPEFIENWFRSKSGSNALDKLKSNTTNVCAIYQGNLFDYLCVLAPQAEQQRIVAKVDELMALCDQLITRIQQASQQQQQLADVLVAKSLA
jgi:type I restriction enzyme, S subunit